MVEYVTSKLKRVFTAIGGGSTVEEVKETQYLKSEEIKVNMERAENKISPSSDSRFITSFL
jgi:hypothetical protein